MRYVTSGTSASCLEVAGNRISIFMMTRHWRAPCQAGVWPESTAFYLKSRKFPGSSDGRERPGPVAYLSLSFLDAMDVSLGLRAGDRLDGIVAPSSARPLRRTSIEAVCRQGSMDIPGRGWRSGWGVPYETPCIPLSILSGSTRTAEAQKRGFMAHSTRLVPISRYQYIYRPALRILASS
jgi:hypothetical protein